MALAARIEDQWQPISVAPFCCDLELAVINDGDAYVLAFPCRRLVGGWLNLAKARCIQLQPTHWRKWIGPAAHG